MRDRAHGMSLAHTRMCGAREIGPRWNPCGRTLYFEGT